MKIIIHDLEPKQFEKFFSHLDQEVQIVSDNGKLQNCIGCLSCWTKTPGKCILKDGFENLGTILAKADGLILISQCYYGGYSPFVKNILERCVPYMLPFFNTKEKLTHHEPRYQNNFQFSVHFYGEKISQAEMDTARSLVQANSINFFASQSEISFAKSLEQLSEGVV